VAFSYRIRTLTDNINILGERRLRILTNFVAGRIDIVFFGLPKLLFTKLERALRKLLENKISIMTEVHKPRIVIEGSLILFMIASGIYRIQNPDIILSSLEILSFLLILRLLPALQQFTSNIRAAAAASWAIKDLRNLLRGSETTSLGVDNVSRWNCNIKFNLNSSDWFNVEVTRGDSGIKNNTFLLKPGVVNVIKGPSGAGKSTLLKTIIETLQVRDDWNSDLKDIISYLPQDPISLLTTFEQNILMGEYDSGELLNEDLEAIGFTNKWVKTFDQSVSSDNLIVSGGEAQRIALLRCFNGQHRKIFFFDEPTSALDPQLGDKVAGLIEAIARRGCFVILVSHNELNINKSYLNEIFI
jgi:ABC-type transport system involved in cytochrome bd biosynthesis fused ATPase/permease subunit